MTDYRADWNGKLRHDGDPDPIAEAERRGAERSTYIDCTVCGMSPNACEDVDGGCCSGCRATGGCSHGPVPVPIPTPQARPSEQDWAEALAKRLQVTTCHHDDVDMQHVCSECALVHMKPLIIALIAREREAAEAEGMAAVAGPVLAVLDAMGDPADPMFLHPQAASLLIQTRAAIPSDATEALARLKAQWQAEERERCREGGAQ